MSFQIKGFGSKQNEKSIAVSAYESQRKTAAPRKSIVQVRFPGKDMALAYYNDQFDLNIGDRVYVDGKLEGQQGRMVDISYNFKIKVSEYKKVIAVCDTDVSGQFFLAGSHFVTFAPATLPVRQIVLWFKAPGKKDDEEVVSSSDDTSFRLDDLSGMNITNAIAQRGYDYYIENRVQYICLDGANGYAIVEGNQCYAVEFEYRNGSISNLICECPCCCSCKHEFAAMLQLRETLELINKYYALEYERSNYFAAITRGAFFSFAIDGKKSGTITL